MDENDEKRAVLVVAWKELTDGLFRKLMGAGIVFYSMHFVFGVAQKFLTKTTHKDVLLMILTFVFSLVTGVIGFYFGAAHKSATAKEDKE